MDKLFKNNTPRWIIFLFDVSASILAVIIAYLLRFNFNIPTYEIRTLPLVLSVFLLVRIIYFYLFKTYAGIIRYTSTEDAARIFLSILSGSITLVFFNVIRYFFVDEKFLVPFSIIGIELLATTFALITFRIGVKVFYMELKNPSKEKNNAIIYGAGGAGVITKRAIDRDVRSKLKVVAFIDDDKKKNGKQIEQVKIYHTSKLDDLISKYAPSTLVISSVLISSENKKKIIEKCLQHNITVLNVPPINKWINGELSFKQIKSVNIEDLLGRKPIVLDTQNILKTLSNKTILITGAAGSIGSEIVRQLFKYEPEKIILLDIAESPLYDLDNELKANFKNIPYEIVIADVRNFDRMKRVFDYFKPQVVFHAAAYKHVPLMENNPAESVLTNVIGTKNIADLSLTYQVEKFILISTDKAVNPTNVMGATKRMAELYIQTLNNKGKTKYIVTRFGNVLGSNGSVIPLFKRQIERGGPVTVTHPEITRYFMTIPEACQLVLQAAAIGNGGEVFVFDMGKSVKIVDLAKKMIKLSGLELGKDIQIVFTGLRPGEKLYEELLADKENTLPTPHEKIMIAKVAQPESHVISQALVELEQSVKEQDNVKLVKILKQVIPEYKSINSVFENLDN
jgi:FlaA1/EpsC-like NDP-sugar epimerase